MSTFTGLSLSNLNKFSVQVFKKEKKSILFNYLVIYYYTQIKYASFKSLGQIKTPIIATYGAK